MEKKSNIVGEYDAAAYFQAAVNMQAQRYLRESEAQAKIFVIATLGRMAAILLNNPNIRQELREGRYTEVKNGYKGRASYYIVAIDELERLSRQYSVAYSTVKINRPVKRHAESTF